MSRNIIQLAMAEKITAEEVQEIDTTMNFLVATVGDKLYSAFIKDAIDNELNN